MSSRIRDADLVLEFYSTTFLGVGNYSCFVFVLVVRLAHVLNLHLLLTRA